MAGKRAEAYALYCRAHNLADDALKKFQMLDGDNKVILIICFLGSDWWTVDTSLISIYYLHCKIFSNDNFDLVGHLVDPEVECEIKCYKWEKN